MDEATALQLIETLSNGVHPLTGEILPDEHVCHQPDMVRALCLASRALEERRQRMQRQRNLPANVGKSWDKEETDLLVAEFRAGKSFGEIAQHLQRTSGGIQARLEKLGLIQPTMLRFANNPD